jgi:DNA-binding transcriptional LysR family regulator
MRQRYPDVRVTVLSMTSDAILSRIENLEADLGISYVDTEPPPKFEAIPLYEEQYVLLVSPDSPLAKRDQVTWAEAGQLPLCLLTPDMQNRRLIDRHLADAGSPQIPTLESNSMLVLYAHVRTGEWASILPARLAEALDRPGRLKPISLVQPTVTHKIGLIVTKREPHSPLVAAFIAYAKRIAAPTRAVSA